MNTIELLAEPRRREILRLVWEHELAVSDIASQVDVTIAAVSQHLARLHVGGLVTLRKDGRRRLYTADRHALEAFAPLLIDMWSADLDRLSGDAAELDSRMKAEAPE